MASSLTYWFTDLVVPNSSHQKTLRQWRRSGVFIVNFQHISHLVPVFLLLTLSKQMPAGNTLVQDY